MVGKQQSRHRKRGYSGTLHKNFRPKSVTRCLIEAQTGQAQRLPQRATEAELRAAFNSVYDVSQEEILVALETHDIGHLHEGEQELSVHALKRDDAWLMSGPDAASMNFGCSVGHADRLVSLGQDSSPSSVKKTLSYKTIIKTIHLVPN